MAQNLSEITLGAVLRLGRHQIANETPWPIYWQVVAKNHTGYPSGSVTLMAYYSIDQRALDAAEPNNGDPNRVAHGNNRYSVSNIDQWLNSNAAAGQWYSARHSADQAPDNAHTLYNTGYDTRPGFLYHWTAEETNMLLSTNITCYLPMQSDIDQAGTYYETISRKVFLPALVERYGTSIGQSIEGARYALFANNNYNTGSGLHPRAAQYTTSTEAPPTSSGFFKRTPDSYNGGMLNYNGYSNAYANQGNFGIAPVINLAATTQVSNAQYNDDLGFSAYDILTPSTPLPPTNVRWQTFPLYDQPITLLWDAATVAVGSIGSYEIWRQMNDTGTLTQRGTVSGSTLQFVDSVTASDGSVMQYYVRAVSVQGAYSEYAVGPRTGIGSNTPPVISGQDGQIAASNDGLQIGYTITDANNDVCTATERLDGVVVKGPYTVTLGQQNLMMIRNTLWWSLANGSHTATITAIDSVGNSVVRTYTFAKSLTSFSIVTGPKITSSVMPTNVMLTVNRAIPSGASFQIWVCNNAYAATPTWEDCTSAVVNGVIYTFTNTQIGTGASTWGIAVKVQVQRNGATGECYVSRIEGVYSTD
jgi:hypothetical protein